MNKNISNKMSLSGASSEPIISAEPKENQPRYSDNCQAIPKYDLLLASPKDSLHRHPERSEGYIKNNIKDWILRFANAPLRMTIPTIAFLLSINISTAWTAPECNCGTKNHETECCWEIIDGKDTNGNATKTLKITGTGDMGSRPWSGSKNSITNIDISGVTSIGNYAFDHMEGVTSLTIPDSVTSIGSCAFCNMTGVTSLKIPDSVTSIKVEDFEEGAFRHMYNLTELVIPDSWDEFVNNADNMLSDYLFESSCFTQNKVSICPNAKIVCQGNKTKCQTALAKFGGTGNCTVYGIYCIASSQIIEATDASQCTGGKTDGMYEWSDTDGCQRKGQKACNATSKYYFNSSANSGVGQCQKLPKTQAACTALTSGDENISWNSETNTCSRAVPQDYIDSGGDDTGGDTPVIDEPSSESINPLDCYNQGKVYYQEQCLNEYPFAKKHWTPAEAAEWLNDDDNTVTITFKK